MTLCYYLFEQVFHDNVLFIGGYLNGKGKVSLQNVDCTLEGNFVNGKLHGPVRGLTSKGKSL